MHDNVLDISVNMETNISRLFSAKCHSEISYLGLSISFNIQDYAYGAASAKNGVGWGFFVVFLTYVSRPMVPYRHSPRYINSGDARPII